jgi:hypothetical protein
MKVTSGPPQNTLDSFSRIINRVSLFYPPIVQIHAKELLYIFPKLKDKGTSDLFNDIGKASVLESLSSSTEEIPDLFVELRGRGLLKLLCHQEPNIQTFSILVLVNLTKLNSLSLTDIEFFLPCAVETFTGHPSERCRKAFYSLAFELSKLDCVKTSPSMKNLVVISLVYGMNDVDEIRPGISQLITDDLPGKLLERFVELMSTFHLSELESSFLSYVSFCVLELTRGSPNFIMDMYDSPLPSARFDALRHINTNWNSSMAPLFAPTQTQAFDDDGDVVMRATAAQNWTPTQDISQMEARSLFSSSQSESSLSLTSGDVNSLRRPRRATSRIPAARDFAKEAERRSRRDQKAKFIQGEARTKRVTLHRAYRVVCLCIR